MPCGPVGPVPAVLPCGPHAIGSPRERTRCSSTVTMAPAATSGAIFGKTAARSALTRSMRDEARRREMTEGAACPDSATIAEKSRSWVTTDAAVPARVLDDLVIGCARREDVTHPLDVVPERTQEGDRAGRDVQVGEQPHATAEVRSLASQAPYLAAW